MLRQTTEGAGPTTIERIKWLEQLIGVSFPETYRAFLLKFNGGRPSPADVIIESANGDRTISLHFFFGVDDKIESCDLSWNFGVMRNRLPKHVIPIATDDFGNLFCLDLRTNANGPVFFWDHELEKDGASMSNATLIAATFSEFLTNLTDPR